MFEVIWFVVRVLFVLALAYFCMLGIVVWIFGKVLIGTSKVIVSSGGYI